VETALEEADGALKLIVPDPPADVPFASNARSTGSLAEDADGDDRLVVEFSEELGNPNSDVQFSAIETRSFSFNSPYGACPECEGIGSTKEVDEGLVIDDSSKPLKHVFEPWSYDRTYYSRQLDNVADHFGVSLSTPSRSWTRRFSGSSSTAPTIWFTSSGPRKRHPREDRALRGRHPELGAPPRRDRLRARPRPHRGVHGRDDLPRVRGNPAQRAVATRPRGGHRDHRGERDVDRRGARALRGDGRCAERARDDDRDGNLQRDPLAARLHGGGRLGYITLDREASTLSGGESQRIRLATQVGSGLVGVLYVLDEPSIGLHQRDNDRLLNTLAGLRDLGNTLVVVEHDEETMRRADEIIDMGPGPGKRGGEVVAQGDFDDIVAADDSITADYLSGRKDIPVPEERRDPDGELTVRGARQHNLKNLDVSLPLGTLTTVTGVSGSGKSTLIHDVLYKGIVREMNDNTSVDPGEHDAIDGMDQIETVRLIDQSPIGRTPRSNPATYTDVFDYVRELFAETKLSKRRGYEKGRFSFNVKGGRCEECGGQGTVKIEMNFLSDVYVPCEECGGARYNDETLEVTYKDATISDVLDMSVDEAYDFFESHQGLQRRLKLLKDVGLGYMELGQPSTTLSGGEAQRVKLAEELGKKATGDTLYLLDEPTTGLHKEDERKLIDVLHRLVDAGNTVVVIEHELDLVKNADRVIDLGPEGGDGGGELVANGTPEDVAREEDSHTGRYLRDMLPAVDIAGPRDDRRKPAVADDD